MGKSIIVFFSKDGNTRLGATLLNGKLNGTVLELKEARKGNFLQALFKKGTPLVGSPWLEIADARQIYLMLPIWASNGVPAMNTFLEHADFTDKEVCIITFQQFTDLRGSENVHKHLSDLVAKKHGIVRAAYALIGGKMGLCASEQMIAEQIEKVQIL